MSLGKEGWAGAGRQTHLPHSFLLVHPGEKCRGWVPLLPSQPKEEETCAGEIGGWKESLRSCSIHYSISLDLALGLSEVAEGAWK